MFYFLLIFLLCYVIYTDMAKRKIFNWVSIFLFFVAILYKYFGGDDFVISGFADSLSAMGSVFFLFFFFYRLGWMGAGDVKFGSVLAFLLGVKLFLFVFVFSGLINLLFFIFRKTNASYKYVNAGKVSPYGAFMSFSTILLLVFSRGGVWWLDL